MTTTTDRSAFLRGMRTIREFRPGAIPDGIIADILEIARWTGSAMNSQPWQLIVVRDPKTLEAIKTIPVPNKIGGSYFCPLACR